MGRTVIIGGFKKDDVVYCVVHRKVSKTELKGKQGRVTCLFDFTLAVDFDGVVGSWLMYPEELSKEKPRGTRLQK